MNGKLGVGGKGPI